jgi:hypothetical protein
LEENSLYLQGRRISQARNYLTLFVAANFLLGLLFDPEDGSGDPSKGQDLFELHGVTTMKIIFLVSLIAP